MFGLGFLGPNPQKVRSMCVWSVKSSITRIFESDPQLCIETLLCIDIHSNIRNHHLMAFLNKKISFLRVLTFLGSKESMAETKCTQGVVLLMGFLLVIPCVVNFWRFVIACLLVFEILCLFAGVYKPHPCGVTIFSLRNPENLRNSESSKLGNLLQNAQFCKLTLGDIILSLQI